MGLKKKPSSSWNPQSNSVLERVHQVFGDMMRTFELGDQVLDENEPFQKFLTDAAYAIRSTYLTTQEATPAQLVFGRDMVLPVDYKTDWKEITKRKQRRISASCERENKRRIEHVCERGGKVLMKVPKKILRKLERVRRGPYSVISHNENGTVTIQKSPCVTDVASIRRVGPFFEEE